MKRTPNLDWQFCYTDGHFHTMRSLNQGMGEQPWITYGIGPRPTNAFVYMYPKFPCTLAMFCPLLGCLLLLVGGLCFLFVVGFRSFGS